MPQNEHITNDTSQTMLDADESKCLCDKKQCILGIASIAIGVGGFALASLL